MRNLVFLCSLLLIFGLNTHNTCAQKDSIVTNTIFLKIDNLNFVKNNEYSNNIADGYTLIGSQLHPKVAFIPHQKTKLEIGVFGLTYAGLNKYHKIIPTFSFTYALSQSHFTMGSYYGVTNHNLIAPLMAEERNLDERMIENGLQYKLKTSKFAVDTWLNWEHFIFKNDTRNEEFVLGLSAQYSLLQKSNWQLDLALQNLIYHRGGQINTDELESRNVFTMRHTALGVALENNIASDQKIAVSSFYIQHQTGESPEEFHYESGYGILTNFSYNFQNWNFGLGYWHGNKFVSPRGDNMYQSVSTKVDYNYIDGEVFEVYANYREPERDLFLGNISYKKELLPNINLALTTNLFYQDYYSKAILIDTLREVENRIDFSISISLSYSGQFKLN